MIRRALIVFVALALLLPAVTRAAEPEVPLSEYLFRLREVEDYLSAASILTDLDPARIDQDLEAAQDAAGTVWRVATRGGPVTADLRPLVSLLGEARVRRNDRIRLTAQALAVVREHLAAAESVEIALPPPHPSARQRLDQALQESQLRQRQSKLLVRWLSSLLGGDVLGTGTGLATVGGRGLIWLAAALALIGLYLVAWHLARELRDRASSPGPAGSILPVHPPTPDELRTAAGAAEAAGDYRQALRLIYLALLCHFDRLQLLRYFPAQTNREHEVQLFHRNPRLAAALSHLGRLVEERLFAGRAVTGEDYVRARQAADALWQEGDAVSNDAGVTTGAS